jgi:hypothetical protein
MPTQVGQTFNLYFCNSSAATVTVTAGDGNTTVSGHTSTASHNALLVFNGVISSNPTWTLYL